MCDVLVEDAQKKPATCEVTLWAVDEAILRLTGYETPDLLGLFYPSMGLSTHLADTRTLLLERKLLEEKGEDGGGGGMEEAAGMDVSTVDIRRKFLRLAYYEPKRGGGCGRQGERELRGAGQPDPLALDGRSRGQRPSFRQG